jgi:hypothetical protein
MNCSFICAATCVRSVTEEIEYNADVCHNSNEFAPALIDHVCCQIVQRQIMTSDDYDVVSIGCERVGGYVGDFEAEFLKQGSRQSGE